MVPIIVLFDIEKIIFEMRRNPKGIRFSQLKKVCDFFFGDARNSGTSHLVYKKPWQGDPRINIQDDHGKAKAYQVKQVLEAIDKLRDQT